jgi:hypothetical protein
MQYKREGNIVVAKFTEGAILENLSDLVRALNAHAALILNGIGMLAGAKIGYFDGERYVEEVFEKPMELLSLQGNIGERDGECVIHAHATLAGSDHLVKGGHVLGGSVCVVNEIALALLPDVAITRVSKGALLEMELG